MITWAALLEINWNAEGENIKANYGIELTKVKDNGVLDQVVGC